MADITLLHPRSRQGAFIGGFEEVNGEFRFPVLVSFDATISESHEAGADVSSHPVEGGDNISDNVQQKPRTLRMEVTQSATPLVQDAEPDRVFKAHEKLLKILEDGKPVRVVTSLEDHGDMVLVRYQVPRSSTTGQQLKATLEWQEVNIITGDTVPIPASLVADTQKASGKDSDQVPKQSETGASDKENEKGATILGSLFG